MQKDAPHTDLLVRAMLQTGAKTSLRSGFGLQKTLNNEVPKKTKLFGKPKYSAFNFLSIEFWSPRGNTVS